MAVRHYKIVLTTVGPLHIGDGGTYGKKDYFSCSGGVAVLDVPHFIEPLQKAGLLEEYCAFLETDSRSGLQDFLDSHPQAKNAANSSVLYKADTPLARARSGSYQYFEVATCIKGADGRPYVPGSSVKGMLRTALLTNVILNDRATYAALYDSAAARGEGRKNAGKAIEHRAFWRERPDADDPDVVNDVMRYVSVSDSEPLSVSDLVFVKKYDKFSKGDSGRHKKDLGKVSDAAYYEGNAINIYRESIKPGVRIELTLDVDERIDGYLGWKLDRAGLQDALDRAFELYTHCFLDHFDAGGAGSTGEKGSGAAAADDGRCRYVTASGLRCRNSSVGGTGFCNMHKDQAAAAGKQLTCYLGGGVDFDSKTVVNALFEDDCARVDEISRILYAQFPTWLDPSLHARLQSEMRAEGFIPNQKRASYRNGRLAKGKEDHRHWKDVEFKVSPHTMKFGIVGGKKYPMGKCSISIAETR